MTLALGLDEKTAPLDDLAWAVHDQWNRSREEISFDTVKRHIRELRKEGKLPPRDIARKKKPST